MNEKTKQPLEFKPHKFRDKIVLDRGIFGAALVIAEQQSEEEAYHFLHDILFYAFCPERGFIGGSNPVLAKAIIDRDNK